MLSFSSKKTLRSSLSAGILFFIKKWVITCMKFEDFISFIDCSIYPLEFLVRLSLLRPYVYTTSVLLHVALEEFFQYQIVLLSFDFLWQPSSSRCWAKEGDNGWFMVALEVLPEVVDLLLELRFHHKFVLSLKQCRLKCWRIRFMYRVWVDLRSFRTNVAKIED